MSPVALSSVPEAKTTPEKGKGDHQVEMVDEGGMGNDAIVLLVPDVLPGADTGSCELVLPWNGTLSSSGDEPRKKTV